MLDPHTAQQRRNRREITKARKTGPNTVMAVCRMLYAEMTESNVWPDSWSEVERAYEDARREAMNRGESF
jgi:hypothetical protein